MVYLIMLALAAAASLAAWAIGAGTVPDEWHALASGSRLAWSALGGLAAGACLPVIGRRLSPSAAEFLMAFDHESAHAFAAVLTGGRVEMMSISASGHGKLRHAGSRANWFVALAPYVVPTTTVVALLITWVLPGHLSNLNAALVTLTLGYHLASDFLEVGPHQPDIQDHGGWLALLAVGACWALTLTSVMAGLLLGAWATLTALSTGIRTLWDAITASWPW